MQYSQYRAYQDVSIGGGPPRSFAVGVASLICLRDNPNRRKVTIINDSDTTVYLSKFQEAVVNAGIRINAAGGVMIDEPDNLGYIYTGPWSAISGGAAKNITIIEE